MRLRIDLAYDGAAFHGWARQPGLRTVQGIFEEVLHTVLRIAADDEDEPLRLVVAGRTDTGVHASHQVCHLDVGEKTIERCVGHMEVPAIEALKRRLRHDLPDDINLHDISIAPEGFDARFSALERTYVYRIADGAGPAADPRLRGFVFRIEDELDIAVMNEAAVKTIGLHDFGSFATPNPGGTTIREVKRASWRRVPMTGMYGDALSSCARCARPEMRREASADVRSSVIGNGVNGESSSTGVNVDHGDLSLRETEEDKNDGVQSCESLDVADIQLSSTSQDYVVPSIESGLICFTIVADAFARNMVRSLVNACVQVGRHRKSLDWFAQKIDVPVREGSTGPIAACGLTLEHVDYPIDAELGKRAEAIRARRTLNE
ncbi:tRNA pseudouridine38-40 synthase [Bifidobacterium commune]|uniref:tRNA pseudouridine synthase A n=1 Tax=Bifidobacterium commune TaxID=1505727 RepID=A0A1C4H4L6_9BIFI|nr:tRNA pseudouridine synthase A [Bifidobacterium commune]MBB2955774.1 tRNA pseudouridine38-40 synthase [Bifidobacterium commune]SCC79733.1 tRNA pseudouridine(38-40) synthase [Bifidobacterium commune]